MGVNNMEKPAFTRDQLTTASSASKNFGSLRKRAKIIPQFISDNGDIDTVVLGYGLYEQMYQRLMELEEKEEALLLSARIDSLEQDPASAVSWKSIRRTE